MTSTTARWPAKDAKIRAQNRPLKTASGSAPTSSKYATISECPRCAADKRGVVPESMVASKGALNSKRTRATSKRFS
eukprot:CAMPEP_0206426256 /NCGR_PEP_ID=MMETSP0324_2-20121206/4267_1 /ASSEMBLY_ACC=CAM_ASM_000836 /TAXON_ID=2866 /ORGANISM="Crypthecodinium cohnii, Strain Seligo" /LENGTH=76 /DNA_ID=CAMNT_0053891171 /DNA_START=199 /DNA_END=429 /DNA_ORIENTATION=-